MEVHLHRHDVERQRNPIGLQPHLADAALRVERDLLVQGVAQALHDAALNLARDGARIERPADVLHHGIAQHLDVPGLRIDRQLAIVDGEHRDLQRVDEMTARAARLRGHRRVR